MADDWPQQPGDYTGQEQLVENLKTAVAAARRRGAPLDHMLFYGSLRAEKHALARTLASEMGVNLRFTDASSLERSGVLATFLTSLKQYDFLFIDDVHLLSRTRQRTLCCAMDDFVLDMREVTWPRAGNLPLTLSRAGLIAAKLPSFTVIGATPQLAGLSPLLHDHFHTDYRLERIPPPPLIA
jgi:holliday junction DNA helicase RuvB